MSNADTPEKMAQELARLRAENQALKEERHKGLSLKVSEKGGLSLYGLGRFPVTLYKDQWLRLLEFGDTIRHYIGDHDHELKGKA